MKSLILITLITLSGIFTNEVVKPSGKDPCSKSFIKKSKKKSSYIDDYSFQTKYVHFYSSRVRGISTSFKCIDSTTFLVFRTYFDTEATTFKREFNFGKETKIAFYKSDSTKIVLNFDDANSTSEIRAGIRTKYYHVELDVENINTFKENDFVGFEVVNPFGDIALKDSKAINEIISQRKTALLRLHASCFMDRM